MGRFTDPTEVIINTETRSIEVTKKGVYFAFRDQGACLSILAVKVYYLACPAVNQGFAQFPQTPTGPEVTSILKISGKCVENAEVVDEPYNLCQGLYILVITCIFQVDSFSILCRLVSFLV